MTRLFLRVSLSLWIATALAWGGAAESPPGDPTAVETAGLQEPFQPTVQPPLRAPESPVDTLTRAHLLIQIESTDPTAWLLRFGRVETRPLTHADP